MNDPTGPAGGGTQQDPIDGRAGRDLGERGSGTGIRAEAVIDLAAIADNTAALLAHARRTRPDAAMMAVVKADGYGHGAVPAARAALAGGATSLGLATPDEAVAIRSAGIDAPLLAWLWLPDQDLAPALAAGVALGVSGPDQLAAVARAGGGAIHLKVDTGLGRSGVPLSELPALARRAAATAGIRVEGVMSHLACADEPDDPSVAGQIAGFQTAVRVVRDAGLTGVTAHLANTPAVLQYPDALFDQIRCGLGIYGLDPLAPASAGPVPLRPAMTLRARVALTKRVPAGQGVSYGLTYRTGRETTLALVPLGYADGIPRAASSSARVLLGGRLRRVAGRVAMDQFVLDCGDDAVRIGDEVLLFGPGDAGEPSAEDFAGACGTIGYEIVTRIGGRVPRRHITGHRARTARPGRGGAA